MVEYDRKKVRIMDENAFKSSFERMTNQLGKLNTNIQTAVKRGVSSIPEDSFYITLPEDDGDEITEEYLRESLAAMREHIKALHDISNSLRIQADSAKEQADFAKEQAVSAKDQAESSERSARWTNKISAVSVLVAIISLIFSLVQSCSGS